MRLKLTRTEKKTNKLSPIPLGAAILIAMGALAGIIHIICIYSSSFADGVNISVGAFLRFVLAKIFNIFPFSFMEYLFICSGGIIAYTAYLILRRARRDKILLVRSLISLCAVFSCVYTCFAIGFAPGYRGTTLFEKLSLTKHESTSDELYETAVIVTDKLNELCSEISYSKDGASIYTKTYDDLSKEICRSYEKLSGKYSFIKTFDCRIKPIVLSRFMTYTHISGIYSFFTGEANLNTNYPDFINIYTSAHEMAHQRGISREDEANFTAFLVLLESEDAFLKYSAYLNMFGYLADALYNSDLGLYRQIYARLDDRALGDLVAYSSFFDTYRDSNVADVTDKMNNAYLESQGTQGTESYGLVVDLAIAYYLH